MKVLIFFLSIIILSAPARGQRVDTTQIVRLLTLEQQIDSLAAQLIRMDSTIQRIKYERFESRDIANLLAEISGEEENIPEDQRSRRKRLDALLKAITDQPGQLRFNGGMTGTVHLPTTKTAVSGIGSFNIFAHTTFTQNTLMFLDLEAIGGNGPNTQFLTLSPLNADGGSTQDNDGVDRLSVNEAWVEIAPFDGDITVTSGKIDLSNYFDNNGVANDETSQFLSGAFVNSASLPFPGTSPGIRVRTTVAQILYLQAALGKVDNTADRLFSDLFKIGSLGFKIFSETPFEGNIRVYGYFHPIADHGRGVGISFDQSLSNGITVFARWNSNNEQLRSALGLAHAWSAGGRWITYIENRRLTAAAAFGEIQPDGPVLRPEQTLELYVRYQLNKWMFVSPHFQVVSHAGGGNQRVSVFALRTQLNF